MVKKITSCFMGLILLLFLQIVPTQAAARYLPIEKARAGLTTSPTQPAGYLIDDDSETYWGF